MQPPKLNLPVGRLDWFTIILAVLCSLIGIFTLYGGSELGEDKAMKSLVWLFIGLIVMFTLAFTNYQSLGSYAFIIYAIGVALLILVLIPFIGTKVKGARSWIRILGFGFQPAEFMKLALVIALSKYLVLKETEIGKFKELIIPFVMTALPLLLIAAQPDLGYAVLILPILFMLLFIGGANISVILGLAIIGFSSLFIPMYLEYLNFVMVDDIIKSLQETNYKLADAVRILNFEVWQYIANPELAKTTKPASNLAQWALKTISVPENIAQFKQTVAQIEATEPNIFRDYLRSDLAMFISILVSAALYGLGLLGFFMTRGGWMKVTAKVCLIIALSLLASFAFRKFVNFKPHQVERIVSFANPEKFKRGAGYQLRHSLITLGSGQLAGKGPGEGDMTRGDTPFLPEWFNDFIFSVIGEQLGFVGSVVTLLLLFGIVFRGATIAIQSKDDFGALLASGITTTFFFHIIINTGITMGLFPVTGVPLTFVSYGGSNMLISFVSLGILLNINMRRHINA